MRKTTFDARFNLKDPNSDRPTLVYLFVNGGGGTVRLKYSTGLKIEPARWNSDTQQARTDYRKLSERQEADDFNSQLARFSNAVKVVVSHLGLSGQPVTKEVLKEHLDRDPLLNPQGRRPVTPAKIQTLTEYAGKFIEDVEAGTRRTGHARRYAVNTVRTYRTTLRSLEAFKATKGGKRYELTFDAINETFYQQFTGFLTGRGSRMNTIGKTVKIIKTWMVEAFREGLHDNKAFREFKIFNEETVSVYLNRDQLKMLYQLDLSQNKRLDRIRDLFLVGCNSGLRYGDWHKVRVEAIKTMKSRSGVERQLLQITTGKTGERITVPVGPELRAILAKYEGTLPAIPSNQKTNDFLKELGQKAGFNTLHALSEMRDGKRISRSVPQWELITTHTARRSFATNLILAGVPVQKVMKLTGHKKEATFQKYVRMTGEDVALQLSEHEYFVD